MPTQLPLRGTTALITGVSRRSGSVDILVCNQAKSGGDGSILDMTAERVDAHWPRR